MVSNEVEVRVKSEGAKEAARELDRVAKGAADVGRAGKGGGAALGGFKAGLLGAAGGAAAMVAALGLEAIQNFISDIGEASKATNRFEASLGHLDAGAVAEAGAAAGDAYRDGFGESLAEAQQTARVTLQNIGNLGKQELTKATGEALAISETFGAETEAITRAVGQMIRTGLARDTAEGMDLIARGFQIGNDKAGDFLETMNEYGTQFRKLGIDGETALGLINQGLRAGARDADKVADALKEFSIRAIDGSTKTAAGFELLGLSADTMASRIAKGGDSASSALDETLERLRGIEDPVKRAEAAVALFGTQAEDLGDALYALEPGAATDGMGDLATAAEDVGEKLQSGPIAAFERLKREAKGRLMEGVTQGFQEMGPALESLDPHLERLRVALKGVAEDSLPEIKESFEAFTAAMSDAERAELLNFLTTIGEAAIWLGGQLLLGPIRGIGAMSKAFSKAVEIKESFVGTVTGIVSAAGTLPGRIGSALSALPGVLRRQIVEATRSAAHATGYLSGRIIGFFLRLPGRIRRGIAALPGIVGGAIQRAGSSGVSRARQFVSRAVSVYASLPGRARGVLRGLAGAVRSAVAGAGRWLYSAGRRVVSGFVSGFKSAIGWGRGQISSYARGLASGIGVPGFAHGGIVGSAAGGGPRGGSVLVGEHGPELVDLAPGSRVHSNPDTRRMLSAGDRGGAQKVEVVLRLAGSDGEILDAIARAIQQRGGVEATLGA